MWNLEQDEYDKFHKEEAALVDSFFLPGGLLDPDDYDTNHHHHHDNAVMNHSYDPNHHHYHHHHHPLFGFESHHNHTPYSAFPSSLDATTMVMMTTTSNVRSTTSPWMMTTRNTSHVPTATDQMHSHDEECQEVQSNKSSILDNQKDQIVTNKMFIHDHDHHHHHHHEIQQDRRTPNHSDWDDSSRHSHNAAAAAAAATTTTTDVASEDDHEEEDQHDNIDNHRITDDDDNEPPRLGQYVVNSHSKTYYGYHTPSMGIDTRIIMDKYCNHNSGGDGCNSSATYNRKILHISNQRSDDCEEGQQQQHQQQQHSRNPSNTSACVVVGRQSFSPLPLLRNHMIVFMPEEHSNRSMSTTSSLTTTSSFHDDNTNDNNNNNNNNNICNDDNDHNKEDEEEWNETIQMIDPASCGHSHVIQDSVNHNHDDNGDYQREVCEQHYNYQNIAVEVDFAVSSKDDRDDDDDPLGDTDENQNIMILSLHNSNGGGSGGGGSCEYDHDHHTCLEQDLHPHHNNQYHDMADWPINSNAKEKDTYHNQQCPSVTTLCPVTNSSKYHIHEEHRQPQCRSCGDNALMTPEIQPRQVGSYSIHRKKSSRKHQQQQSHGNRDDSHVLNGGDGSGGGTTQDISNRPIGRSFLQMAQQRFFAAVTTCCSLHNYTQQVSLFVKNVMVSTKVSVWLGYWNTTIIKTLTHGWILLVLLLGTILMEGFAEMMDNPESILVFAIFFATPWLCFSCLRMFMDYFINLHLPYWLPQVASSALLLLSLYRPFKYRKLNKTKSIMTFLGIDVLMRPLLQRNRNQIIDDTTNERHDHKETNTTYHVPDCLWEHQVNAFVLRLSRMYIIFLIVYDGFGYSNYYETNSIWKLSTTSRLLVAWLIALLQNNMITSPLAWIFWSLQVLVVKIILVFLPTYQYGDIILELVIVLMALSSIRYMRVLQTR